MSWEYFPVDTIFIPDKKNYIMAVWLEKDKLRLYFQSAELRINLDKRALPYLVDALIELQNQ